jgi:ribonuclease HI
MSDVTAQIHTDGAARGNPGPAAWAYVIGIPGRIPVEAADRFGNATNNVAEYMALIRALERASTLGLRRLAIFSDSELMVRQMNGDYAVKNADLRALHAQAEALARPFASVTYAHVRRAENARADALCNAALDGRPPGSAKPVAKASKKQRGFARRPDVESAAIESLRAAARAWGESAGRSPSPELVWDQLWSILDEAGVLKKSR